MLDVRVRPPSDERQSMNACVLRALRAQDPLYERLRATRVSLIIALTSFQSALEPRQKNVGDSHARGAHQSSPAGVPLEPLAGDTTHRQRLEVAWLEKCFPPFERPFRVCSSRTRRILAISNARGAHSGSPPACQRWRHDAPATTRSFIMARKPLPAEVHAGRLPWM